jgi:hypothetical protein
MAEMPWLFNDLNCGEVWRGLDPSGAESDPVAGFYQHGDEPSGSLKARNLLTDKITLSAHEEPRSVGLVCFSVREKYGFCT